MNDTMITYVGFLTFLCVIVLLKKYQTSEKNDRSFLIVAGMALIPLLILYALKFYKQIEKTDQKQEETNINDFLETVKNIEDRKKELDEEKEKQGKTEKVESTINNPFGNFLLDDNRNRGEMVDITLEKNKSEISKNFNTNLYLQDDDIYNRNNSSRQFYKMPVTTVINDQTNFAKKLYGNGRETPGNNEKIFKDKFIEN